MPLPRVENPLICCYKTKVQFIGLRQQGQAGAHASPFEEPPGEAEAHGGGPGCSRQLLLCAHPSSLRPRPLGPAGGGQSEQVLLCESSLQPTMLLENGGLFGIRSEGHSS